MHVPFAQYGQSVSIVRVGVGSSVVVGGGTDVVAGISSDSVIEKVLD